MASRVLTNKIKEIAGPIIEALGCVLWGVQISGPRGASLLRVYIDKEQGVDVDDCAKISRHLSAAFDVEDVFSHRYTLEVSSPGMDRPLFDLSQYRAHLGSRVSIKLTRSFEERKNFSGVLVDVEDENYVVVEVEGSQFVIPFEWILRARIEPEF